MEDPSLSRRSPPSTRKSRKPLQHPNPEWKSDRILAPSPDGWNIMKEGIPHDYVNKKIIRKHLTRERINIHTDFHNGHPGHSQYLASYIAKTRSRWKRVIYGFQNTPTMVKLRIKCMHATFSYFLTSNPVPETKGRNLSQLHSLQKFSQYNAIEKNWMNEDRYRKRSKNNHFHRNES